MAFATMASAGDTFGHVHSDEGASALDILDKNALTTAGVAVAAGTAVAGGMVVTAALPAQVLTLTALSGALIYAGDRQAKGLPLRQATGRLQASAAQACLRWQHPFGTTGWWWTACT